MKPNQTCSLSFQVGVYYTMIIAWCFYYFFVSFAGTPAFAKPCPINHTTKVLNMSTVNSTEPQYYEVRHEVEECHKAGKHGEIVI